MYMTNLSFNKKNILFILSTTIVKWLFQNYVLPLLNTPRSNKGKQKHDEIFQNDVHCTDVDTEQTVQTVVRIFTGRHEIFRKWFFCLKWTSRVWQRCFGAKYQFLFEMVLKGPDGPERVPNGQKHFWPSPPPSFWENYVQKTSKKSPK